MYLSKHSTADEPTIVALPLPVDSTCSGNIEVGTFFRRSYGKLKVHIPDAPQYLDIFADASRRVWMANTSLTKLSPQGLGGRSTAKTTRAKRQAPLQYSVAGAARRPLNEVPMSSPYGIRTNDNGKNRMQSVKSSDLDGIRS